MIYNPTDRDWPIVISNFLNDDINSMKRIFVFMKSYWRAQEEMLCSREKRIFVDRDFRLLGCYVMLNGK